MSSQPPQLITRLIRNCNLLQIPLHKHNSPHLHLSHFNNTDAFPVNALLDTGCQKEQTTGVFHVKHKRFPFFHCSTYFMLVVLSGELIVSRETIFLRENLFQLRYSLCKLGKLIILRFILDGQMQTFPREIACFSPENSPFFQNRLC